MGVRWSVRWSMLGGGGRMGQGCMEGEVGMLVGWNGGAVGVRLRWVRVRVRVRVRVWVWCYGKTRAPLL